MTAETVDDSHLFHQQLVSLYNNEDMSDIQIIVGGKVFYSHKLVLTLHSDVFKTMLTSGTWPESRSKRIVLQEEPECVYVFEDFLKYLYGGKIILTNSSVLPVLSLADKYNIKHLSRSCTTYMSKYCLPVSEQYLIMWLQYAVLADLTELERICRKYISCNFEAIANRDEFLAMNARLLVSFLKSSDLVVSSELTLYKAVHRWLSCQSKTGYQEHFVKLMIHIRFPMMQLCELPSLEKDCFLQDFKDFYLEMIFLAIKYHACHTKEERQAFIQGSNNKKVFYPRNYTSGTWGTTLSVENFWRLIPGEVQGAFFTTPMSISEKSQHEYCDWHLHLYPKGMKFDQCVMIDVPRNLTVGGQFLRNVRLSISSVFNERVQVEICVLLMAERCDGLGQDYVHEAVMRHAIFDKDCTLFNIDDLVPYEELNEVNSVYVGSRNTFKITVLIKPEYKYHF